MLNILCIVSHDQKKSPENQNYFGGGQNGARLVTFKPPLQQIWAIEWCHSQVIWSPCGNEIKSLIPTRHTTSIYLFILFKKQPVLCVCVQSVPAYNGNACNFFAETPRRLTVSLLQRVSHFEWLMATSSHAPGVCCFFLSKSTRNILN